MNQPTDPGELARLAQRVIELKIEHRDLDEAIERLQADPDANELVIKRLKKRKLHLKDCIARMESSLIPDEPA
ncbi:MAG TPA: YdcH family protein [Lysobacter sp.]|nr:YdcH family protein [Lysobacter sp.]